MQEEQKRIHISTHIQSLRCENGFIQPSLHFLWRDRKCNSTPLTQFSETGDITVIIQSIWLDSYFDSFRPWLLWTYIVHSEVTYCLRQHASLLWNMLLTWCSMVIKQITNNQTQPNGKSPSPKKTIPAVFVLVSVVNLWKRSATYLPNVKANWAGKSKSGSRV